MQKDAAPLPGEEVWVQLTAHRNARNACPSVSSWGSYRAAGKDKAHVWRAEQARAVCINGRKISLDRLVADTFVPKSDVTRRPARARGRRRRELRYPQPGVVPAPVARPGVGPEQSVRKRVPGPGGARRRLLPPQDWGPEPRAGHHGGVQALGRGPLSGNPSRGA
eukprot:scaffold4613_cov129-Isochrysis_galbana.AAC.33